MRYIRIPHPISFVNLKTKEKILWSFNPQTQTRHKMVPVEFIDFILTHVLDSKVFAQSPMALVSGTKVLHAFEEAKAGEVVVIDETQWGHMVAAVSGPWLVYPPQQSMQLMAFHDAIAKAPEKEDELPPPPELPAAAALEEEEEDAAKAVGAN